MKTLLCVVLLSVSLHPTENRHHGQESIPHRDQGLEMMDSSGGKPDERHGFRRPRSAQGGMLDQPSGLPNGSGSSEGQPNLLYSLAQSINRNTGLSGMTDHLREQVASQSGSGGGKTDFIGGLKEQALELMKAISLVGSGNGKRGLLGKIKKQLSGQTEAGGQSGSGGGKRHLLGLRDQSSGITQVGDLSGSGGGKRGLLGGPKDQLSGLKQNFGSSSGGSQKKGGLGQKSESFGRGLMTEGSRSTGRYGYSQEGMQGGTRGFNSRSRDDMDDSY